jgi:hypothetical protein
VNRRELVIALGAALAGCKTLRYRPNDPQPLDDHELATLAAIADTFLPGPPSGTDVGAVAHMIEPAHGLLPYVAELVGDLDQWCLASKLRSFKRLSAKDREVALEQRMGLRGKAIQSWYRAAYEGALALTKLAFCDHPHGAAYLAFPGTSRRYDPASAAGAYASSTPTIDIAGAGAVQSVHAGVLVDAAAPLAARIVAPDGRAHAFEVRGSAVDLELALAGTVAAGRWRLDGAPAVRHWWLRVRT